MPARSSDAAVRAAVLVPEREGIVNAGIEKKQIYQNVRFTFRIGLWAASGEKNARESDRFLDHA
jgi:hypothetical protein